MLQKFKNHIAQNFPFLEDKKLLIAISGGIDSIVLTHLLHQLKFNIELGHCNFQLRNTESNLDEYFVQNLGKKLNLKTYITKFNTKKYSKENKLSTQIAARELRYNWFQELVEKHSFDYVLTAHHADDNLETFLINLTRGTGLEGLTGIPAINKNIIRPLLIFSRKEIEQYTQEYKLEWREDASNLETKYLRNKIRHEVVPKLKEINANLLDGFAKTSLFLKESEQIINDRINEVSSEIIFKEDTFLKIDIQKTIQLSNPKAYLYQILKDYGFTAWNDIVNLLNAKSGKQIFSKSHRLLKDRKFLFLSAINTSKEKNIFFIDENETKITQPIFLKQENTTEVNTKSNQHIFVDKDLLKYPLTVRKWQNGDYFYPIGMSGKKKLSTYFKDKKFSVLEKENIWLLCTAKNEIVWVLNHRQDKRFLASIETKNSVKISIKN